MKAQSAHKQVSRGLFGFTLVELSISLALIAVIATLAIPSFFGRSEITLENAAELLAMDIRSAQNRAAFLNRDVHIHFMEEGAGYWVDDAMNEESALVEHSTRRDYSENAVFEGVRVSGVILKEGTLLSFGSRGVASTTARITLSFDGESRVVTVQGVNGHLAIEGSTRGWVDSDY